MSKNLDVRLEPKRKSERGRHYHSIIIYSMVPCNTLFRRERGLIIASVVAVRLKVRCSSHGLVQKLNLIQ